MDKGGRNPEVVEKLFVLVNRIVEEMITRPSEIDDIYKDLPEEDRKKIAHRDKKKKQSPP
ncbi:MAG: hypothetical protein OEQ39_26975 [Gammaproteobacteria bacterium]|nr:hypothetical protein [Gammaproteobacteria bacterium]